MGILQEVSDIIDIPIREGRWLTYLRRLNAEGRPDRITTLQIIFTICKDMEVLEAYNARLLQRVEALEANSNPFGVFHERASSEMPFKTVSSPEVDQIPTATSPTDVELPNKAEFKCDFPGCQFSSSAKIGLLGHRRSHKLTTP